MTGVTSPVLGEGADDADLVDDVAPVLVVVIGAREATRHPHDRDVLARVDPVELAQQGDCRVPVEAALLDPLQDVPVDRLKLCLLYTSRCV